MRVRLLLTLIPLGLASSVWAGPLLPSSCSALALNESSAERATPLADGGVQEPLSGSRTQGQEAQAPEDAPRAKSLKQRFEELHSSWLEHELSRARALELPSSTQPRIPEVAPEFRGAFESLAGAGSGEAQMWLIRQFRAARSLGSEALLSLGLQEELIENYARLIRDHAQDQELLVPDLFTQLQAEELAISSKDQLLEWLERISPQEVRAQALLYRGRLASPRDCADPRQQERAREFYRTVLREAESTGAASAAELELWRLDHLSIGRRAPGFRAWDAAGNEIVLSDFLGQVLVIRFWSSDAGSGLASLEQAEKLSTRFWDRRFTWIGVNLDRDPTRLHELLEELRPGPSHRDLNAWEGGLARPATETWRIEGRAETYVLDQDGIIRGIDPTGPELERLVVSLLSNDGGRLGLEDDTYGREQRPRR